MNLLDATDRLCTSYMDAGQAELRRLQRIEGDQDLPPLVEALRTSGKIDTEDATVRRAGFTAALGAADRQAALEIALAFCAGGFAPPSMGDVVGSDTRRGEIYRFLVKSGILIVADDPKEARSVTFHRDAVADAVRILHPHLSGEGITTPEANQLLGITRKFGIPSLNTWIQWESPGGSAIGESPDRSSTICERRKMQC